METARSKRSNLILISQSNTLLLWNKVLEVVVAGVADTQSPNALHTADLPPFNFKTQPSAQRCRLYMTGVTLQRNKHRTRNITTVAGINR